MKIKRFSALDKYYDFTENYGGIPAGALGAAGIASHLSGRHDIGRKCSQAAGIYLLGVSPGIVHEIRKNKKGK